MKKLKKTKIFIFGKKSQCRKKTERGDLLGFFTIHSVAKHQKNVFWEKFFFEKKVSQCRKNERGESLVSPGMVCYAEKQEKPFWFSSLDQIVHFDAIIFCRTFVELFWSVRVDRKKVTIIVAFHFMKRRLKVYGEGEIYRSPFSWESRKNFKLQPGFEPNPVYQAFALPIWPR